MIRRLFSLSLAMLLVATSWATAVGAETSPPAVPPGGVFVLRERNVRPALFRIPERRIPHNLHANTRSIREIADAVGYPDFAPQPLFLRGALPGGYASGQIQLEWSDPITITWNWDGKQYLRTRGGSPHTWISVDGTNEQVSADVLLVIVAPVSEPGPPPGTSGSPVLVLDTVGEGALFVFADGQAVRGRWNRSGVLEPFEFWTLSGERLLVPAGRPWINIFPEGRVVHS